MNHILGAIGIGLSLFFTVKDVSTGWKSGGSSEAFRYFVRTWTGYDVTQKRFTWQKARAGLSAGVGIGGSIVAAKTGANRYTPKGWNL